jgi:hypothetical protein
MKENDLQIAAQSTHFSEYSRYIAVFTIISQRAIAVCYYDRG